MAAKEPVSMDEIEEVVSEEEEGGGGGEMCGRMDLTRFPKTLHAHDFTPPGRVVMTRKKEQRTFASPSHDGQEQKFETLTKVTVETFRGNKIERKVTSIKGGVQKKDSQQSQPNLLDKFSLINVQGDERVHKKGLASSSPSILESNGPRKQSSLRKKSETLISSEKFAQECLAAHNSYREKHKAPPLKLSKKLCKYSEEWAREMAAKGEMSHRPDGPYGENLFQIWSPGEPVTGAEPVKNWYSEISEHVFGKEPTTLRTGHFSQVVWLESCELGVGVAKSKSGQVFVVANYDPPGNFIGSFAENVPPLGGFKEVPKSLASEVKNDDEFREEMLSLHNELRANHGSPPLQLNAQLCDYAQEWAVELAKEGRLEHRKASRYGENLFSMWGSRVARGRDAALSWYSESKGYAYGSEPRALNAGHFTQMVWRESRELGVGRAKGPTGVVVIVANYEPRGNVMGQFAANVLRPRST